MKNIETKITGGNWVAKSGINPDFPLQFFLDGNELLRILPVSAGIAAESSGMLRKCRRHFRNDKLSCRLEYECKIPLGTELVVRRDMVFTGNHCRIIYDFDLKGPFEVERVEADPLLLPGEWQRCAIVKLPPAGKQPAKIEWQDIPASGEIIFQDNKPFLLALFENKSGQIIEIGTGDDLWRWHGNSKIENASSNFAIQVTTEGISIERTPFLFAEKTEFGKCCRRFKWYFAWSATANNGVKFTPLTMTEPWPEAAMTGDGNGNIITDTPCFESAATEKRWKKIVRTSAGSGSFCHIDGVEPHLCAVATHLERGSKKTLRHWDMMALMDFYLWANQHLAIQDGGLTIAVPPASALRQLPSLTGMANLPPPIPDGPDGREE